MIDPLTPPQMSHTKNKYTDILQYATLNTNHWKLYSSE